MRAKTIEMERYIRDAAVKRGIDPDTAVKVAKSEGLGAKSWQSNEHKKGRREKSYGPFQLNIEKGRLGAQFMKATGLDPRDPSTVEAQIDFALDHAAKHGWGSWFGAARVGVAKHQGLAKAQPIGVQAVAATPEAAPAPSGGLASFFSDPLGMQAQAAEAPAGLAAYAAPEAKGLPTANQPALSQQSFDARLGAPAAVSPERFAPGLQAPAGPFSPEHYAEAKQPSSAKARAAFDAIAAGYNGVSTQPGNLGAQVGAMVGPAPAAPDARMSPDGKVADPFGNYKQAGPLGTIQKAETERMPGAALAYAPEQQAAPALSAPQDVKDYSVAKGLGAYSGPMASLSPDMMAPQQFAGMLPDMAPEMPQVAYDKLSRSLAPPEDPQVAEIAGPTVPDPMGTYPDAPTPENTFPEAPPEPSESLFGPATKRGLLGLALGGPIGGLLGYASSKLGGMGLGDASLGPASAGERFGVGTGLAGIQRGMYGERGATGYSRSNPNTSVTSRGRNLGWDLSNQYGAVTHYDANGNIAGATPSKNWGGFFGGLFGGDSKKDRDKERNGISPGANGAIGRGLGGLY